MVKNNLRLLLGIFILISLIVVSPAFAEVKVFEQEVEEAVSRGQSQEQVEAFALQKAKRLAVEEAGTYISSLTVVKNYQLQKDEVTALASGIVQAKIVGIPSVVIKNGVIHVTVKAKITVDTAVLNQQIQEIMKEKGTLKKLEDAQKNVRELENKLANLKSSEVKRLEEINTQALALERERDRQRLFREDMALKARGELSKAEAERFAKEREMQEKISRTLAAQEKAKREEAAALAAEQDRIKRAQLENEQRWNDLARKAQLAQNQWAVIDDSLSLKQALTEVTDLKREIANLKKRLDFQYNENEKNMKAAYAQQRALTTAKLPPAPAPRDGFEPTEEYNARISTYERQVKEAQVNTGKSFELLRKEENLKLAEAKVDYLRQQIRMLTPFIKHLQDLQARKFSFPEGGAMTLTLGEPDADNTLNLQHNGKSWSLWWKYTDRNSAKDFYRTRTYLKAEGLFQIDEAAELRPKLTVARVTHPGTKETRDFYLEAPKIFTEIAQFTQFQQEEVIAKDASKKASIRLTHKEIGKDGRFFAHNGGTVLDIQTNLILKKTGRDGRFFAYDDGTALDIQTNLISKIIGTDGRFTAYNNETVLDTRTGLMWAAKDNGSNINWQGAKSYCENYRGGGYSDWRMPTQDELAGLYDANKKNRHGYNVTALIENAKCCPWASETRGSEAAYFFFGSGSRLWGHQSSGYNRALPVRSW